ncbi:MAG: alpha/beta hydrolase [Candidatus Binatia bacterium]
MTRFTAAGTRTAGPKRLSLLDATRVFISGVNVPRPHNSRTPAALGLTFETHHFRSEGGSTLEAWFVPGKDERLIIALFHGYAASKSTLLSAARAFQQHGYGTLLVDFYGSGASSGSGTTIGVKEAGDVAATVEFVRRSWPERKVVLYGISMGGAAVLRSIAANGVTPDAIIIEATFDSLLNTAKNRFRAMGLPGSPFAEMLLFWGSVQNGFNMFSHNPVDYARTVKHPALILHGEQDDRATLDQARRIALAMGTNARFVSYAGVPHMSIVDARPAEWARDVASFVERIR